MTMPQFLPAERSAVQAALEDGATTKAGLPKVDFLTEKLGRSITAAERDWMWSEFNQPADAGGSALPAEGLTPPPAAPPAPDAGEPSESPPADSPSRRVWMGPPIQGVVLAHKAEFDPADPPRELTLLKQIMPRAVADLTVPLAEVETAEIALQTRDSALAKTRRALLRRMDV